MTSTIHFFQKRTFTLQYHNSLKLGRILSSHVTEKAATTTNMQIQDKRDVPEGNNQKRIMLK